MRRAGSGKSESPNISVCFLKAACKNDSIQCHVFTLRPLFITRVHTSASPPTSYSAQRISFVAIAAGIPQSRKHGDSFPKLRCSGRIVTERKLARYRSVFVRGIDAGEAVVVCEVIVTPPCVALRRSQHSIAIRTLQCRAAHAETPRIPGARCAAWSANWAL